MPDGFAVTPAPLTGGEIDLADCPDLGPILTALAVFCQGESRICHAGRLRLKESDRIAAMEEELRRMGRPPFFHRGRDPVTGGGTLEGGCTVSCHNDHRIAMSLAVAATCCRRPVTITGRPGGEQVLSRLLGGPVLHRRPGGNTSRRLIHSPSPASAGRGFFAGRPPLLMFPVANFFLTC